MKDLITIGIPVYNVEKYVEKALLSALDQTYDNIEYIIVDDKGTDNSMFIINNIISNHPRGKDVKIIEHQDNIGTGAARNDIINTANGKYIFYLDSDDEILPDCIEKLYMKMQDEDVDFIIGSFKILQRTGETISDFIYDYPCIRGHLEIAWQYFEKRNRYVNIYAWNKLYKTSFLRDNNIYCIPNQYIEDIIFLFQILLNAYSCAFITDITYYYCDTPNSVVKQIKKNHTPYRICSQYTDIISFEWEYVQNYRHERVYESLLSHIVFLIFYFSNEIRVSRIISSKEKKYFLKKITEFPISFKEIFHLKRKRLFFFISRLIFKMPFNVLIFKFILDLSKLKKKIVNKKKIFI